VAKYLLLFSYTSNSAAGMAENSSDRVAAVSRVFSAAGGRLESMHWMLGPHDGVAIVEVPDSTTMAAVSLIVRGTGALKSLETYQLLPPEDIQGIEQKARDLASTYQAPGHER
jgi:uncharacterized protein with GYD domain